MWLVAPRLLPAAGTTIANLSLTGTTIVPLLNPTGTKTLSVPLRHPPPTGTTIVNLSPTGTTTVLLSAPPTLEAMVQPSQDNMTAVSKANKTMDPQVSEAAVVP